MEDKALKFPNTQKIIPLKKDKPERVVKHKCKDDDTYWGEYCEKWAKDGNCNHPSYEKYMKKFCKKSCNLCKIGSIFAGSQRTLKDISDKPNTLDYFRLKDLS